MLWKNIPKIKWAIIVLSILAHFAFKVLYLSILYCEALATATATAGIGIAKMEPFTI